MNIKILFFGAIKDIIQKKSIDLNIEKNTTVLKFKNIISKKYPNLKHLNSYAIAVNEEYVEDDFIIKENAIIAIIPPVSGG